MEERGKLDTVELIERDEVGFVERLYASWVSREGLLPGADFGALKIHNRRWQLPLRRSVHKF